MTLAIDLPPDVEPTIADVLSGLTPDQIAYRIDQDANPISWLVWHLTRVQDDHVAKAFGAVQVWSSGGWAKRFGLPEGTMETGYGHTTAQVGTVGSATASASLLAGYHVVKVDVGEFDHNLRLVAGYVDLNTSGIPALAETSTEVWQYRQSIPRPRVWCSWLNGIGCSRTTRTSVSLGDLLMT